MTCRARFDSPKYFMEFSTKLKTEFIFQRFCLYCLSFWSPCNNIRQIRRFVLHSYILYLISYGFKLFSFLSDKKHLLAHLDSHQIPGDWARSRWLGQCRLMSWSTWRGWPARSRRAPSESWSRVRIYRNSLTCLPYCFKPIEFPPNLVVW